jgi:hypothetical protein
LAGITAKLTVRPEEATYFDRKEKKKRSTSFWALSLEVEGDDMRKLIANLTENARLFAETRKLLGSSGKVFEVVEDDQEQAPEVAAEFYPASANDSAPAETGETGRSADPTSTSAAPKPAAKPSSPPNGTVPANGNGSPKSVAGPAVPPPAAKNGNGSAVPLTGPAPSQPAYKNGDASGAAPSFNQLRNEFLTAARRVATTKKQPIGEVVEWASGGAFKYGDVGRMTEADTPKLRAATQAMASGAVAGAH